MLCFLVFEQLLPQAPAKVVLLFSPIFELSVLFVSFCGLPEKLAQNRKWTGQACNNLAVRIVASDVHMHMLSSHHTRPNAR